MMTNVSDPRSPSGAGRPTGSGLSSASQLLDLTVEHVDGCAIVAVAGEIDITTAPQLTAALERAVDEDGARDVAIDLAGVSFLDSTAIHVFATTSRKVRSNGGRFALHAPSEAARRVLDLVGLPDVLPVVDA